MRVRLLASAVCLMMIAMACFVMASQQEKRIKKPVEKLSFHKLRELVKGSVELQAKVEEARKSITPEQWEKFHKFMKQRQERKERGGITPMDCWSQAQNNADIYYSGCVGGGGGQFQCYVLTECFLCQEENACRLQEGQMQTDCYCN